MDLEQALRVSLKNIDLDKLSGEAQVRESVVGPILRALDWEGTEPEEFVSEFPVGGGRSVDYALCRTAGNPLVFIEAKKPGKLNSEAERQLFGVVGSEAEQQLFGYASEKNVPLLVLTDGSIWNLYLRRTDDDSNKRNSVMRKVSSYGTFARGEDS